MLTRDESDLAWFYCEASGALGLRGQPIEPSIKGTSEVDEGVSDQQLEAATRHRRISEALASLTHDEQRTLRLAFAPLLPAFRAIAHVTGDCAGLVVEALGSTEAKALAALADEKGKTARKAATRLRTVASEARERVAAATRAYGAAKRLVVALETATRRARYARTLCAA